MSAFFDNYLLVVGFVAVGLWLLIGIARLYHSWHYSQVRTAGLRQQKAEGAKALLKSVEDMMQIDRETKESRQRVELLKTALETKEEQLTNLTPPPPPAIYVTSEFPPSSKDKPWQTMLRRTATPKIRRADEPSERYVLVWALDHTAAQGRAQNALANFPGFTIDGTMRFE
jgi:hypothetical protein